MSEHSELTIAIAGNPPNCGKTTLFNALTGTHQQVGNWPGVTVEKKEGRVSHQGRAIRLVDLPGVYSLSVAGGSVSLDERLARDFILTEQPDLVVNVVDAANLERNLYLTVQLLEMGAPLVLALNMMDVARSRRIAIDTQSLSQRLGGCPVIELEAASGKGIGALKDQMVASADTPPPATPQFQPEVEAALDALEPVAAASLTAGDPRWLALKHLEGGDELCPVMTDPSVTACADELRAELEANTGLDADTLIACGRYDRVTALVEGTVNRVDQVSRPPLSDRLDRVVLNRMLGIPIFLAVMYLMFMFTINIGGGAFIDFFDILAGTLFVDGMAAALWAVSAPPQWLVTVLADGVGGGIQTVATFIPIVACLFLFLSILEDSGYMARAAFVMDRFMRMIGLPGGKSFVPLIVAFGCNVPPAIMATRTLDSQRDRTLTVMMAPPFMSCGARLPVYALFAAAFFPVGGQNMVFGLYLLGGLLAAVGTGLLLKVTILKGKPTPPFVMELPPYHMPTLRGGLSSRTWHRLRDFLQEAGQIIVVMVAVLAFLNSWGAPMAALAMTTATIPSCPRSDAA